jgi:hypothetical protein
MTGYEAGSFNGRVLGASAIIWVKIIKLAILIPFMQ